jgi:thiol-disulfide isomerase/thioredoxin
VDEFSFDLHPEHKVRAPEFGGGRSPSDWINSDHPLQLTALRGKAVLLDIWDYTCLNCLRTLPYIRAWHERYAAHGLVVIGLHTPEFTFGRERTQIELATRELNVRYPVLLDNEFRTWKAYDNRFWPARYLIDHEGYIRFLGYGEGNYQEFERAIQSVLREIDPDAALPPLMPTLRDEDQTEAPLNQATPELRTGLHRGALGNPEGYAGGVPILYRLPTHRVNGAFYVSGAWQANDEYLAYKGTSEGIIQLPYEATEVNAVLSPHHDSVERFLHPETVAIEIWQDDLPLTEERRGIDLTEDGRVLVSRPRVYNLIRNPGFERHELTLRVKTAGFALYAFSFVAGKRKEAG